jgi:hypothetical protein
MKCRDVGALLLDAGIGCAARICGAAARHMIEARFDWPQTITLWASTKPGSSARRLYSSKEPSV